jgi:hypothetical protein
MDEAFYEKFQEGRRVLSIRGFASATTQPTVSTGRWLESVGRLVYDGLEKEGCDGVVEVQAGLQE